MRPWASVRLVGSAARDDGPADPDFVPWLASEHDRLLAALPESSDASWAAQALRACLEGVRHGSGFERIAVTDAWVDGEHAFCVVYTPLWGSSLAGVRRERGDPDPIYQLSDGKNGSEPTELSEYAMPEDPAEYGSRVHDDITEPLGRMVNRLRYDADGVGWWGTLGMTLPQRSQ